MDSNDRQAIETLFGKLREVESRAAPRDSEAEAFIRAQIARQPGAPYYMAQTIIVQEEALRRAEQRIAELEREAEEGRGPFGGLFGGRRGGRTPSVGARGRAADPWGGAAPPPSYGYGGGGFLAGAAQTALGVAGGVLLGSMIAGAFSGGSADAAEAPPEEPDDTGDEGLGDDQFLDSGGGDFDGGFDGGGDF